MPQGHGQQEEYKIASPMIDQTTNKTLTFYSYRSDYIYPHGSVEFYRLSQPSQVRADFFVDNPTKKPIDFKGAKYYGIHEDSAIYYFEFDRIDYNDGVRHSEILNPNQTIRIYCNCPVFLDYNKIKSVYIQLANREKIHFVSYNQLEKFLKSPMRKWEDFLYRNGNKTSRK